MLLVYGKLTVVVSLACCENAFVVVGELHEVYAIALTVVGVDLFTTLKIVETHREVFTASHQVLAIM